MILEHSTEFLWAMGQLLIKKLKVLNVLKISSTVKNHFQMRIHKLVFFLLVIVIVVLLLN